MENNKKDYLLIMMTGAVLAIHWTTFFQSIQVSSVAIGTITFSTFPLFLTFLEPIVFHERVRGKSILCAIILLIGVAITIPEFSMENQVTIGIVWGMISSLTYAIITLANRYFSKKYDGRIVSFYEQGTAAIVLLPSLLIIECVWNYLCLDFSWRSSKYERTCRWSHYHGSSIVFIASKKLDKMVVFLG